MNILINPFKKTAERISGHIEISLALKALNKIPLNEWPAIYCKLNCWQIPNSLSNITPSWWDKDISTQENLDKKFKFINPLIERIRQLVSEKEISREWNKERMTDVEFELWWMNKLRI